MAGRLEVFDALALNLIAIDYLGQLTASMVSPDALMWLRNTGDAQVSNIVVTPTAVPGNDGLNCLRLAAGLPVSAPTGLTALRQIGSGSIAHSITRHYKVAARGVSGGLTLPSAAVTISTVSGDTNVAFRLAWNAVAGATGYAVYTSLNGADYYLIGDALTTELLVVTAAFDTNAPTPVLQPRAYYAGGYSDTPLVLGELDPGYDRPIFYHADVPSTYTAVGNRRRVLLHITGVTV